MEYFSNNLVFLRKKAGKKQGDVNFELGFTSQSRYGNYETGHSKPDFETLISIAKYFKVSVDDLIGRDLSKKPTTQSKVEEPKALYSTKMKAIPLIPIDAMAGIGKGDLTVMESDVEKYFIPDFNKKADFLIRISGTSMSPKYFHGDVVACKIVPTETFIQWGKVYVMDTVQGALCKRLMPGSRKGTVKVVSDNQEAYPAFELDFKNDIRSLAIVVGMIRLE